MDCEIKCYGTNMKHENIIYTFIPFTNNCLISIKTNIKCNLQFILSFNESIESVKIYQKNNIKQHLIDHVNNLNLMCKDSEVIKIVPVFKKSSNAIIKIYNIKTVTLSNPFNYDLCSAKSVIIPHNADISFIPIKSMPNLCFEDTIIPKNNIIISLTSIPTRLITNEFITLIDKLYNQKLKPKYIIINLCKNYRRQFTYDIDKFNETVVLLNNKYHNVIINLCDTDYGPITKIMGLLDLKGYDINEEDKIIVVDDDWYHLDIMTTVYEYCYQLYECDAVFINERDCIKWDWSFEFGMNFQNNEVFFYDNYQNFAFGWLTFSFKYKTLSNLKQFYNELVNKDNDIWQHDDLILTLYYKYYKLYACGIGRLLNEMNGTSLVEQNALKNASNAMNCRVMLETKFLNMYGYKYTNINKFLVYIYNDKKYPYNTLNKNINTTNLTNCQNVNTIPEDGQKIINVKYINKDIICLTIFYLNDIIKTDVIRLTIDEYPITFTINNNNFSKKQSYFIKLNPKDDIVTAENYTLKSVENPITNYSSFKINLNDNNIKKKFFEAYDYGDETLLEPKIYFRYFCYSYLDFIRTFPIPNINYDSKYESVLIEYRCFPHLEFLIRNMMLKLGSDWSYTIVCGNLNYDFVIDMCNKISPNIKILKTCYDNLIQSEYSKFLASIEFWDLFVGEKILIYQEDSCIFRSNINDFIEWDFIGSPWFKTRNDNKLQVGNGGFSLRTKKIMKNIIYRRSILKTKFNSDTLKYMNLSKQYIGPEDVYFTLNMLNYDMGKVADWDSAFNFSSEWVNNTNSLGGHCFWYGDHKWKDSLFERIFH